MIYSSTLQSTLENAQVVCKDMHDVILGVPNVGLAFHSRVIDPNAFLDEASSLGFRLQIGISYVAVTKRVPPFVTVTIFLGNIDPDVALQSYNRCGGQIDDFRKPDDAPGFDTTGPDDPDTITDLTDDQTLPFED